MTTTSPAPPDLWLDWCAVTGTDIKDASPGTLTAFARQTQAPHKTLTALRRQLRPTAARAAAWPLPDDETDGLSTVLTRLSARCRDPRIHWVTRLRLRRLAFIAVLLAPQAEGGWAMTRSEALSLSAESLTRRRPDLTSTRDVDACPACAVWSWLEIIGTDDGWNHPSTRALAHRHHEVGAGEHRHLLPDPEPDWHDVSRLLPAIDRWGYLDPWAAMHPSSLSATIRSMTELCETDEQESPQPSPITTRPPARHITAEEEAAILARADELNARVSALLGEWDR